MTPLTANLRTYRSGFRGSEIQRLASTDEFLAGSAKRSRWTQLGGNPAAGISDSGECNQTSAGDEHGCDCVRDPEGVHGRVLEVPLVGEPARRVALQLGWASRGAVAWRG
jgi:hypothetical protein